MLALTEYRQAAIRLNITLERRDTKKLLALREGVALKALNPVLEHQDSQLQSRRVTAMPKKKL